MQAAERRLAGVGRARIRVVAAGVRGRRFRHVLRRAYAVELEAGALRRAERRLSRAVEQTGPVIEALLASLPPGLDP